MREDSLPADGSGENIWTSYSTRDRTLLTIGSVASWWIFAAVAGMVSFPRHHHFEGSLMVQPSPVVLLVVFGIVLIACTLLTSFFTGVVHYEAGLFCAAVGLTALSVRSGPIRYVLMELPGNGTFFKLAVELILLFVFVGVAWLVLGKLTGMRLLRAEIEPDEEDEAPGRHFAALGVQIALMIFLMLVLCQTDKKAQAIWSVAIASAVAAWGAHSLFPVRPSIWFWTTPLIVGVIGYMLAYVSGSVGPGGEMSGVISALARPLPLDYASVGVAGSIYGYWSSRQFQFERDHDPERPDEVETALEHPPTKVPAA